MQTGETRIRSKAMPPPNTNPMELDHVRVHVSNPFSRLSMGEPMMQLRGVGGWPGGGGAGGVQLTTRRASAQFQVLDKITFYLST